MTLNVQQYERMQINLIKCHVAKTFIKSCKKKKKKKKRLYYISTTPHSICLIHIQYNFKNNIRKGNKQKVSLLIILKWRYFLFFRCILLSPKHELLMNVWLLDGGKCQINTHITSLLIASFDLQQYQWWYINYMIKATRRQYIYIFTSWMNKLNEWRINEKCKWVK